MYGKTMKYNLIIILSVTWFVFISTARTQQLPPSGYNLKWSDEFNGQSLNTNAWGTGMKPWGTTDNNPCLIVPEDTYIQDSSLVLRCKTGSFGQYHYSCGWAWSKKWYKYGYFEMRAKYPKGKGQWPAWWMLKEGWPPEIDIAEYRGAPLSYMTEAFYWGDWSTTLLHENQGWDFTKWHIYALQWGPRYLIWYVDGKFTKYYSGDQVPSDSMYIIFSGGLDGSSADSTTGFPNYYVIDYFRYYQSSDSGSCYPTPVIPAVQVNFGAWQMTDSINVSPGAYVSLSPYPSSGGTWDWNGCGVSGSSRQQFFTAKESCIITAIFTNSCGTKSTQNFYIIVNPTGVNEKTISKIKFDLLQNYPNPFNPETEIKYSIPKSGFVTIKLFNLLGEEVAVLVNKEQRAGEYSIEFSAKSISSSGRYGSNLPSGIYFYRIQSGGLSLTKKMIILK
jgi:beta-glucanase (GH16 family)